MVLPECSRVDLLLAPLPLGWLRRLGQPSFDPSAWCPRCEALVGRRPVDQVRSLAADRLLSVLCRRWRVPPHGYDPTGRPSCGAGTCLTASHDGDYVVAGIAERAVGVDIVDCRRAGSWIARIMSDDERALTPSQAGDADGRARAWAIREAALKWAGVGLAVDPRALTVARDARCCGGHGSSQGRVPVRGTVDETWWTVCLPDGCSVTVMTGTVGADHALALAVETPATVRLRDYVLDDV